MNEIDEFVHLLLVEEVCVDLPEMYVRAARRSAEAFNAFDRRHRIAEKQGANRTEAEQENRHLVGHLGYLAACWYFGVPYAARVGRFRHLTVRGCRVFTSSERMDDGVLIGKDRGDVSDGQIFIKCHAQIERARVLIQGWVTAADVRQAPVWLGARAGGEAYRLKRVRPLRTLFPRLGIAPLVWPRAATLDISEG